MFDCIYCETRLPLESFDLDPLDENRPLFYFCKDCSDSKRIEHVEVTCSVCLRKLPHTYFQHYRTRFKRDGLRLRVNTYCMDCRRAETAVVSRLKKENPPPNYLEQCPLCERIVYEKTEDIPAGINATNGPWQCDHDHDTKKFRGYICKPCNVGVSGDLPAYQKNAPAWKGG